MQYEYRCLSIPSRFLYPENQSTVHQEDLGENHREFPKKSLNLSHPWQLLTQQLHCLYNYLHIICTVLGIISKPVSIWWGEYSGEGALVRWKHLIFIKDVGILYKVCELKNWCFWTVVLEKTLQSPLDCKEIQPINPKGNQSWIFIGRTDAEAETPILWPLATKNWLIQKDLDAWKDWRQEEKGMTEDKMIGWHHRLNGHEFE